ncbi:AAEL003137-PA [Aedes aegypti]|uniref:AAEL003137-PA n=1 Tax=Aedes aegypti TaxID=7159 RepID=Q17G99_AEDAE|nr:AAEL003137-PA [Aedes aegypti]
MEDSKPLFESKHCISLKCVLFLFYGGLGCIYPFLQSNMAHKGFDFNEIYSISVIIPITALFGPLLFAVLVDKWATSSAFAYGKRVRILTAVSLIASIVLYVLLMFGVSRNPPPGVCSPRVNFMCNKKGAYLMQEKCTAEGVCHDWDHNKVGLLNLENCAYKCQQDVQYESTCYQRLELDRRLAIVQDQDSDGDDIDSDVMEESETIRADEGSGEGGTPNSNDLDGDDQSRFAAPQICHDPAVINSDEDETDDDEQCYTFSGKAIEVKASVDEHNERDDVEECVYPLDGFKCHIDKAWIKTQEHGCKPVIECALSDPYSYNSSLLYGTECDGDEDNDGDDDRGDSTYYYYLSVRSLLDFFLLAALTLFNTIIIITTRDASTGIADFGRQLVWGAIGWIIFFNDDYEQPYFWFIILNTIAAVILLSPLQMDLSPPEEWWKFKTVPQKFFSTPSFVKYAKQCWLPFLITLGLGSLWSIIDSIDKSHMVDIPKDASAEEPVFRTVFRTLLLAGDLLAIPALIFSQRIIQVFGTCKILVAAFLALVVRFILLAIFDWEYWDIIEDSLLPATLGLTWVTIVLHFRDLLPRKVTAIAQSLPVIAHFGFGRFFGALIGIEYDYDNLENDYEILAGVLFAITIISIVLYRYREIVLSYVGQYIPALKPCEKEKVVKVGKGETDV